MKKNIESKIYPSRPDRLTSLLQFEKTPFVATWKFVPWAFADRLWLVWKPENPPLFGKRPPVVKINQRAVALLPRVDFRKGKPEEWQCPLFFADVSGFCRFGGSNSIALSRVNDPNPGLWYLIGSV